MPQVIPLVVTAITTVTSAVIAAGPIAVAAFNAINVIGAAALANEAFKALQPEVRQSGASIEWEANPNAALPFAFGRVGVSGNIVANRVYGPDDMYVGFVSVVSAAGPIKSFVSFKADDTSVSFDASGKAVTSYHANVMWRRTQLGRQPEPSALSSPSGLKNGVTMPGWGASYKLSGKAAYIWTLSENSKRSAYEGRVPTPLNVIEGLYCWDPRLDSSYPGGSGTCRLNDPSTWVWRENPALFALKWALGLWEGPVGKGAPQLGFQVGGIGAKVENVRVDRFVELANIADANGWKAAAWPKADEPKDQVLDSFLQAAGAVYADEQGKISCIQRAAARPSILTITSDDIAGTVEYDTTTSKIGRLNTIRPRYWSAANDWQMAPTDEVSATLWREEDGQGQAVTRSKGIDFNYVPGSKQARELACLLVAHTREGIRGTVPVRSYVDVEPGDAFDFQVPEATLNGLKCLVLNTEPDLENDTVIVTFASESDGKYAYAYGQADAPPPAPELEPSDPTYVTPPLPGDWTITVPAPPADGAQYPVIDLSGFVSNDTADSMLIYWREVPEGEDPAVEPLFFDPVPTTQEIAAGWTDAGVWPPTTKQLSVTGIRSGATVWLAVRYRRGSNVSLPKLIGPITVQTLSATVDPEVIQAQIDAATAALQTALDQLALAQQQLDQAQGALQQQVDTANGDFDTRLDALDTGLSGVQAVNATQQTQIDGKASQSSLSGVINRVSTAESQIGSLNTTVAGLDGKYALASSYNTLASEVQNARGGYGSLSARFSAQQQTITDGLAGKASVTDLSSLQGRVTTAEGSISAQNNRLSTVETDLAGKASASTVSGLSAIVNTRGRTFYQGTTPTSTTDSPLRVGDLWVNTADGNKLRAWDGSQWAFADDQNVYASIGATNNRLSTVEAEVGQKASASELLDLQAYANTRSRTYFQSTAPTSTTTSPLHAGDLWVHTGDGRKLYAWNGSQWTFADDQNVQGFIAAANTRLDSVEADLSGKASSSSVSQLTARVGAAEGTISSVQAVAAAADGKASALVANQTDVNGVITGTYSYNNGVTTGFRVRSDLVEFVPSTSSGARTAYANGKWSIFNSAGIEVVQLGLNVSG